MDLKDLIKRIEQYDGDVKQMEMDRRLGKLRDEDEMIDPLRKLQEEFAKEAEKQQKEIEQNPLAAYSTTELKRELRRRKGKLK